MQEDQTSHTPQPAESQKATEYVAPQIESIIKPDDLEREMLYAGTPISLR